MSKIKVTRFRGRWVIRPRLANGRRPQMVIGECGQMTEARAQAKVDAAVERGLLEKLEKRTAKSEPVATVANLVKAWTSGALLAEHGPIFGLRDKATARDDRYRLTRLCAVKVGSKTFGELGVGEVTEEHVETAIRIACDGRAANTARNYVVTLHKLFELAERPCRLRPRDSNPVDTRGLRPTGERRKIFSFLMPSEVLALVGCAGVPLVRRVAYALAVYTGFRAANLFELRWDDVDFTHETLRLRRTKNGRPIVVGFEVASLGWLLRAWRAVNADELVLPFNRHDIASMLREDLRIAGVTRAVLFEDSADVEPLRFHDLRATFVTWSRRAGRPEDFITARTGHQSKELVDRYARAAATIAELRFEAFPSLVGRVPGLDANLDAASRLDSRDSGQVPETVWSHLRGLNSRPTVYETDVKAKNTRESGVSESAEPANQEAKCLIPGSASQPASTVETLTEALAGASRAGRWDVVAELARQLEAIRLEGSNVVPLRRAR